MIIQKATSQGEERAKRQSALLIAIARPVTWLALGVALVCLIPGASATPVTAVTLNLLLAGLAHLAVRLARRGWPKLASSIFLGPTIASFFVSFILYGGVRGPYLPFLPVFVCILGLIHGLRAGLALALGSSALIVATVVLERHGYPLPHLDEGNLFNAAIAGCSALVTTALVLGVALRIIDRHNAEIRTLERARDQAQRLEGLGRLSSGVAHDLNNILAPVLGAELLVDDPSLSPEVRAQLEQIAAAGQRATALTNQLLAFARRGAATSDLDLNRVIEEFAPLLRRLLPPKIELLLALSPDLPPARAERAQLEQVVLNLVVNARDATSEAGRITVSTVARELAASARGLAAGRYLQLEVRDQGRGMSPEVQERLFEPFFTTKGEAGTGLGLAAVHGIVGRCGGQIEVESEPGRGSTFRVLLPASAR